MLLMSSSLKNRPIMSLRSGNQIGLAIEPIINPHNLKILGWWSNLANNKALQVLLTEDIREVMPQGLAINDEGDLSTPEDLVRHKDILEAKFQLIDKAVKTKRQKLGKVSDFSYNDGMFVQKLYVSKPITKVFSSEDTHVIDRSQIIEVTDTYILVEDTEVRATDEEAVPAGAAATS